MEKKMEGIMKRQTVTLSLLLILITKIEAGWFWYDFCPLENNQEPISVTTLNAENKNLSNIDKAILEFAPVVYFYKGYPYPEEYFPLTMESYLTVGKPSIVYKKGHRKNPDSPTIVFASDDVTMETLGDTQKLNARLKDLNINNPGDDLYLQVGKNAGSVHCIDYGDNPKLEYINQNGNKFTARENGIIKTPYYAIYSQDNNYDYIQYLFLYGYNGEYRIFYAPGTGVGYHKMDLEHLLLQFEKNTVIKGKPKLLQIAFPSHGSGETRWLPADNEDLQWDGKHIIAFAAYHGHGMYPEEGIYIRICGFGNDFTSKGIKWHPDHVIRLYRDGSKSPYSTKEFNKIMGWVKFPGDLGPEGVGGLIEKKWFGQPQYEEVGKHYKEHFCPEGVLNNKLCTSSTALFTCYEPETQQGLYKDRTEFDPMHLPQPFMKVEKGTKLIFYKESQELIQVPQTANKNYAGSLQRVTGKIADIQVGPYENSANKKVYDDRIEITFNKSGKMYLKFTDTIESTDSEFDNNKNNNIRTDVSVEG